MKYLFFDIECSNCFKGIGKICEFGYVITDENFKILASREIPMSPGRGGENRFDMSIYKRDSDFNWAYDFSYYYEQEEYPSFHVKIKKLLEDPDTKVFGHSIDNDIRYLDGTIKRYNLDQIKYIAYDTQKMMKYYSEKHEKFMGLKDAFIKLCGKDELIKLQPHLSRDDAIMSMRVAQEMCKNLNVSLSELIELCPSCKINVIPYLERYNAKKDNKKHHKTICKEAQVAWGKFYRSHLPFLDDDSSIGKMCTISSKIKDSLELTNKVIKEIKKKGLIAFDKINGADYLIAIDEEDIERLKKAFKHPFNGKIITLEEFLSEKEEVGIGSI